MEFVKARLGDRSALPDLQWDIYCDMAAIGPLPRAALSATTEALERQSRHGVACMAPLFETVQETRRRLATLLGVACDELALTTSTSAGVSAISNGLSLKASDTLLLFRGEFPTNVTPWQQAAERSGAKIVWLDADDFASGRGLERLHALLAHTRVRLAAVSLVQFQTGLRMPVEAIAQAIHAQGGEVFVDAIQGLGIVPFDARSVDYVAAGCQKWLMGPPGTGVLWATRTAWDALHPRLASWLSHQDPLSFLFAGPGLLTYDRPLTHGPPMVEGGTLPLSLLAGLGVSVSAHLELGISAIFDHVQRWHDAFEPGMTQLGFRSLRASDLHARSGILAFDVPDHCSIYTLATQLRERGISVSTPDHRLRFAPGWPNSLDEPERVLTAVTDLVRGPRS